MALADFSLGDIGGLFTGIREAITGEKVSDPELKLKLLSELQKAESEMMKAQASTIVAEAKSGGLAAMWRPITMLVFVFIIANNYIIVPYTAAIGIVIPSLDIPDGMWNLLSIGLGGYVVGRSAEKTMEIYAKGK